MSKVHTWALETARVELNFYTASSEYFLRGFIPNPRKPTPLKLVQGTARKSRSNPKEPKPASGVPVCPKGASKEFKAKFAEVCKPLKEMGVLSGYDVQAIKLLVDILLDIESDMAVIARSGAYYEKDDLIKSHPANAKLIANRARAQSLLGEFGLTPAARKSRMQSKTLQGTVMAAVSTLVSTFAAFERLDPVTQYILLGFAGAALIALMIIARERLKRWARGDR